MEYRYLGKTGLRVSEISFGPGNNDIEEDGEAVRTSESAFDLGVTLYDTSSAEKGGRVEEWLGRAFKNKRQDVVLATKFKGGATRKHIILECEKSLKRMNSDYIDIYQFFRWDSTVAIEESLEALTNLVRQGKILYAGCCSFKTYQMANALRAFRAPRLYGASVSGRQVQPPRSGPLFVLPDGRGAGTRLDPLL